MGVMVMCLQTFGHIVDLKGHWSETFTRSHHIGCYTVNAIIIFIQSCSVNWVCSSLN